MTLFTQLHWIKRLGATKRFHGNQMTREETVFHHSASVALILIQIYGDLCSANILRAALTHDLEEGVTGDIPAPVKWHLVAFDLDHLEKRVRDFYHIKYPELTEEEVRMLKAADFIDAVMTCLEQRMKGNVSIDWVFENYREYAVKSSVVESFPEMRELWFVVLNAYKELLQTHPNPTEVLLAEKYNFWTQSK